MAMILVYCPSFPDIPVERTEKTWKCRDGIELKLKITSTFDIP